MAKPARRSKIGGSNIFKWLDQVRERTAMYARSVRELESQMHGYCIALDNHGIVEPAALLTHHFRTWVYYRTGWSTAAGWGLAIEAHVSDPKKQFAKFFRLLDEFRRLVPTLLSTVRLTKRHQPTGKRVVYGMNGRMEKPQRVDIVRYVPEPLHFLRFYYSEKIVDASLLYRPDGSHVTTIYDAKRWVRDELQVKAHEWQKVR